MANSSNEFIPYPNITDPDFYDIIYRKKEFNKTRYTSSYRFSKTEDLCKKGEFKMQNHQEFVRNFISSETPYNGILLFHGTGVGKTCAAIGITEGLRDYVKNKGKIYILSSENIRPNFYKELYDPGREEVEKTYHSIPGSYQCAGDRYYVKGLSKYESRQKAIRSLIKQYYEFFGFGQFANFVDIGLGAELPNGITQPKLLNEDGSRIDIGEYFSNSVIVIDEAHGIAGEDKKNKKKSKKSKKSKEADDNDNDDDSDLDEEDEITEIDDSLGTDISKTAKRAISKRSLFKVLIDTVIPECHKKGHKIKIILLTATPMKDNVRELADLLELLNVNDQRLTTSNRAWRNIVFPKDMNSDHLEDQERVDEIKKLSRGYISYVKGDNPITFPEARIPPPNFIYEPSRKQDGSLRPMFGYRAADNEIYTDISYAYNVRLDNGEAFRFDLVRCIMSDYQFKCYVTQLKSRGTKGKTDSSDTHTRMLSNMVFPHKEIDKFLLDGSIDNLNKTFGNVGFDSVFNKDVVVNNTTRNTTYTITHDIWSNFGNFMSLNNPNGLSLDYFSQKYKLFLDFLNGYNPENPSQRIASPGVVYAYSEFVKGGALIAALILEANGYLRYTPALNRQLNKTTGLPNEDILSKLPQVNLLRLQKRGKSEDFYRCALCGHVYSECRDRYQDQHDFKIATYILVTGTIGGVADIAEATTNNINGEKVKVIIGTKTTGQGVDLKWVRQVHIIDPWHNNTRIYQAIGRGLRHCSHADLSPNDRNVTIYKYASVPNNVEFENLTYDQLIKMSDQLVNPDIQGVTYTDIFNETVDEHMYRRVVRKDLLIKKIERICKTAAIDCELNLARNYFPTDTDYSRNCDYTLCKYTCDGLTVPIKYIRKIRKYKMPDSGPGSGTWYIIDENDDITRKDNLLDIPALMNLVEQDLEDSLTNELLWEQLSIHHITIDNGDYFDLLLDLPLVTVDSSTYDIYFSAPQIDRAVKLISRLYQKQSALSLKRLLHLITKQDADLEEPYIYIAINKLIGNPPKIKPMTIIDRYNREGNLIYHNGFYIFQPYELNDRHIPMRYRVKPLDLKRRYYNMNILAPKEIKKVIDKIPEVDVDKLKKAYNNMRLKRPSSSITYITSMYHQLNRFTISEHKYIVENLVESNITQETQPSDPYILEYYIRTGLVLFGNWTPDQSSSIEQLLTNLKDKKNGSIIHFLTSKGLRKFMYGQSGTEKKWLWRDANTDIPDINYYKSTTDILTLQHPTASSFNGTDRGTQFTFPSLNDNNDNDIYSLLSKTIHRTDRPLITDGAEFVNHIKSAVKKTQDTYPDPKNMLLIKFKILDQITAQESTTKAGNKSLRTNLKGLVCSSGNIATITTTIERLKKIVKDNLETYINPYENTDFEQLVDLSQKFPQKNDACNFLEKLCMILDYYQVPTLNGKIVKWYLTPLEVDIYRPSKDLEKK